jgi:hypothetical protein
MRDTYCDGDGVFNTTMVTGFVEEITAVPISKGADEPRAADNAAELNEVTKLPFDTDAAIRL